MNSRRFMSEPKLRKRHLIRSNEHFDRGRNRHQNHYRSAQPMSLLGQKRTNYRGLKSTVVRCYSNSGQTLRRSEMTLSAKSGLMHRSKQHLYSITSSARAISVGGTVTPIVFAVLRLITRLNLVGCSTGISAGFSPRKILSTNVAARRFSDGASAPKAIRPPTSAKARIIVAAGRRCAIARSAARLVGKLA